MAYLKQIMMPNGDVYLIKDAESRDAIENLTEVVSNKADKVHSHNDLYYTIDQIDSMVFITIEDIDRICGMSLTTFETEENEYGGLTYTVASSSYMASQNAAGGTTYDIGGN